MKLGADGKHVPRLIRTTKFVVDQRQGFISILDKESENGFESFVRYSQVATVRVEGERNNMADVGVCSACKDTNVPSSFQALQRIECG